MSPSLKYSICQVPFFFHEESTYQISRPKHGSIEVRGMKKVTDRRMDSMKIDLSLLLTYLLTYWFPNQEQQLT